MEGLGGEDTLMLRCSRDWWFFDISELSPLIPASESPLFMDRLDVRTQQGRHTHQRVRLVEMTYHFCVMHSHHLQKTVKEGSFWCSNHANDRIRLPQACAAICGPRKNHRRNVCKRARYAFEIDNRPVVWSVLIIPR